MKKVLLALTVLGSATCANAVTVDDLMQWGGYCIENTKSDRSYEPYASETKWLSSSVETKFEKVDDTHIRLTGMFDDEYTFVFTLGNGYDPNNSSAGSPSSNGTQLVLSGASKKSTNKPRYSLMQAYFFDGETDYDLYPDENIIGEIAPITYVDELTNEEVLSGYKIEFYFSLALLDSNWYGKIFDYYELQLFEPNAWITETGVDIYNNTVLFTDRKVPARFEFNEDGTFEMVGLSALGYAVNRNNQLVPITGKLNQNKTLFFNSQQMLFAEDNLNGQFIQWAPYRLTEVTASGKAVDGLNGKWDNSSKIAHKGTSTWVTNDGDCRTKAGLHMTTNNYTFTCRANNTIQSQELYTYLSGNISIDMEDDHTHAVELKLNSYGADDKYGVYVNATITPIKNHNYIESYDLFMVEGTHSSIKNNYFNGNLCPNNGHVAALHLTGDNDFSTDFDPSNTGAQKVSGIEANKGAQNVNLLIPASALPNGKTSKAGYTFFVRANYSSDSNLAPTFHDMKYFQGTPTSIDGIQAEDAIVISAGSGEIIVKGAEGAVVEVYNAAGVQVYAGTDSSIAVEAGLYIVKVGTKAQKVIVR